MARVAPGAMHRFQRLSRMKDFRVDKGLIDPRGWKVIDADGRAIGHVVDLVVDTDRMSASMLEVEVDLKALDLRDDPRLLVPMTAAARDGDRRQLIIKELTRSRVVSLREGWAEHEVRFWEQAWASSQTPLAAEPPFAASPVARTDVPETTVDDIRMREVRVPVLDERPAVTMEDGTVIRPATDPTRTRRVIE